MSIDKIDLKILDLLQTESKMPISEIANKVGLSLSPCWRRLNHLEKSGFIKEYVAKVDRTKLGLDIVVFATIKLENNSEESLEIFESTIQNFDEIIECYVLLGNVDYILKIVTRNLRSYETFLRKKLSKISIIQEIDSRVGLSEVKRISKLPLNLVDID